MVVVDYLCSCLYPYGAVKSTVGDSQLAFGFTGEAYDPYIKLICLRSRMHDNVY